MIKGIISKTSLSKWRALCLVLMLALITGALEVPQPEGARAATAGDEIRIGIMTPISGPAQASGVSSWRGAQLGAQQVNDEGGLLGGKRVRVIVGDEENGVPDIAVSVVQRFLHVDRVHAIIGGWSSATTLAVQPVVEQAQVILLNAGASSPRITDGKFKWTFRLYPTDAERAKVIFRWATEQKKFTKFSYMAIDADPGHQFVAFMKQYAAGNPSIQTVSEDYFNPQETDFRAILTKIQNREAQVIMLLAYNPIVPIIGRQMRELGMAGKVPLMGCCDLGNPRQIQATGADVLQGAAEGAPWNPALPLARNKLFVATYLKAYNEQPLGSAYFYWEAVQAIAQAIRKANSLKSTDIQTALKNLKYETAFGAVSFNEHNQANMQMFVVDVINGKPIIRYDFWSSTAPKR